MSDTLRDIAFDLVDEVRDIDLNGQPEGLSAQDVMEIALRERFGPEVCLCAAMRMADGYIFRGHRHDDCYLTMGGYQKYTKADGHQAVQGFLTSRGRFVTRAEAAELHGIKGHCTSEELW